MAEPPPLRIALGLGDQELEQRLRPALDADPHFDVAVHCLAADHVLAAIEGHDIDAVVLGWSLHRLSESILAQLEAAGVPIVLLAPERQSGRWRTRRTVVLPPEAEPDAIRAAVAAARAGIQPAAPAPRALAAPPKR